MLTVLNNFLIELRLFFLNIRVNNYNAILNIYIYFLNVYLFVEVILNFKNLRGFINKCIVLRSICIKLYS
jgi:hypothetical protein